MKHKPDFFTMATIIFIALVIVVITAGSIAYMRSDRDIDGIAYDAEGFDSSNPRTPEPRTFRPTPTPFPTPTPTPINPDDYGISAEGLAAVTSFFEDLNENAMLPFFQLFDFHGNGVPVIVVLDNWFYYNGHNSIHHLFVYVNGMYRFAGEIFNPRFFVDFNGNPIAFFYNNYGLYNSQFYNITACDDNWLLFDDIPPENILSLTIQNEHIPPFIFIDGHALTPLESMQSLENRFVNPHFTQFHVVNERIEIIALLDSLSENDSDLHTLATSFNLYFLAGANHHQHRMPAVLIRQDDIVSNKILRVYDLFTFIDGEYQFSGNFIEPRFFTVSRIENNVSVFRSVIAHLIYDNEWFIQMSVLDENNYWVEFQADDYDNIFSYIESLFSFYTTQSVIYGVNDLLIFSEHGRNAAIEFLSTYCSIFMFNYFPETQPEQGYNIVFGGTASLFVYNDENIPNRLYNFITGEKIFTSYEIPFILASPFEHNAEPRYVAAMFSLYDFDGNGIPAIVVHFFHMYQTHSIQQIFIYTDGEYRLSGTFMGYALYTANDGQIIMSYFTYELGINFLYLCVDNNWVEFDLTEDQELEFLAQHVVFEHFVWNYLTLSLN